MNVLEWCLEMSVGILSYSLVLLLLLLLLLLLFLWQMVEKLSHHRCDIPVDSN